MLRSLLFPALVALITAGCGREDAVPRMPRLVAPAPRPDELPALLNTELPFRYPAELYARKAQGNVTLSLFIDRDGHVAPESTRVDEPSGYAAFDTAAVHGASELRFVPAKVHGDAIPVSILFPVYFRHPEARPLPGDTILQSVSRAGGEL